MRSVLGISRAFTAAFALAVASSAFAADDGTWSVKKSSGDVWTSSGDVQQASLKADEVLKPGDTIRTGRNGRVLLVRGEESILIAPNSVVGLPAEKKEGLSTTIKQQAGSILLEVEKKNVKHFEVETPYLAAVVKGTQFRVTVNASGATVDVVRGQVEVADFKTGQIAQVMPGQHATTFSHGNAGLSLGGAGTLQPIQHGQPRASTIDRVNVPRGGLTARNKPGSASLQQKPGSAALQPHRHAAGGPKHGMTRISSSLGEVKLNVHRVTHGLARNSGAVPGSRSVASRDNSTVWGSGDSGSNGNSQGANNGNGGASAGASSGGNGSAASSVAAVVAASGGGNGNGNNGNGNGNNGNSGNNGNHGNGNNGNHTGNGGGNGNGRGHR